MEKYFTCRTKNIYDRKGDDYSTWMEFGNLFGLYWGVFFFAAYGEMVLAGVFSQVNLSIWFMQNEMK